MPFARALFWAATLAGVVFSIRAAVTGPPPVWLAAMAAAAYLALLLAGVFFIRLRVFTDAMNHGPPDARGVVLTFDDGPDPVHTREVLDVLAERGIPATFFVIGAKAEVHPDLIREMIARGHSVGVHGYVHDRLFSLRGTKRVRADLERAMAVLEAITGQRPTLFRPPVGHTSPTIARVVDELELDVIGWSAAGSDGLRWTKPRDVTRRIGRALRDGAIVLLHDTAERGSWKPAGVTALPEILGQLRDKNLRVVPLTDWLER